MCEHASAASGPSIQAMDDIANNVFFVENIIPGAFLIGHTPSKNLTGVAPKRERTGGMLGIHPLHRLT